MPGHIWQISMTKFLTYFFLINFFNRFLDRIFNRILDRFFDKVLTDFLTGILTYSLKDILKYFLTNFLQIFWKIFWQMFWKKLIEFLSYIFSNKNGLLAYNKICTTMSLDLVIMEETATKAPSRDDPFWDSSACAPRWPFNVVTA